jgi:hypothetical protein
MHQYAFLVQGKTNYSSGQLESYHLKVDDRSKKIGGHQCISTPDGYYISLNIIQGLPHFFMRPPTDQEMIDLPHVTLTSDIDWDPVTLDNDIEPDDANWYPVALFDY